MKRYSIAKFENILRNDIPALLREIRVKMAKYCPSLFPYSFVKDKMILTDMRDMRQYICDYQLSESGIRLTGVQEFHVSKTYLAEALTNVFEHLKKGKELTDAIAGMVVEAAMKQASFRNMLQSIHDLSYVSRKAKGVGNPIREAFNKKHEELEEVQRMAIKSAARKARPKYAIEEGKDLDIAFSHPVRERFTRKFTWNARLARRSLSDAVLQEKLVLGILKGKIDGGKADATLYESYAANVLDGWLIARPDVAKAFRRMASKHSLAISSDSIKECAADAYTQILMKNRAEVERLVESVYGGTKHIADKDASNVIAVARKYILLKEQDEDSGITSADAVSSLDGAKDEVVDKDVEASTDEESTEDYHYAMSDVEEYINMLKDILKERYPDKYKANYGGDGDEKPAEPAGESKPAVVGEPGGEDGFFESEEEDAGIIREDLDFSEGGESVVAMEDKGDISVDDQTDEIVGDDEEEIDDEASEIVAMIEDLEEMKDLGQIDGERVSEIAGWVYDEVEDSETVEEDEHEGEDDLPQNEELPDEDAKPLPVAESKKKILTR